MDIEAGDPNYSTVGSVRFRHSPMPSRGPGVLGVESTRSLRRSQEPPVASATVSFVVGFLGTFVQTNGLCIFAFLQDT